MLVELHGAGFTNKGAELMLRTALGQLSSRLPDFQGAAYLPRRARRQARTLGIGAIIAGTERQTTPSVASLLCAEAHDVLGDSTYARIMSSFGLADLNTLEALVDLSGFAFSDEWGPDLAERFARVTECYASKGRPVVLLPQALGPFRNPKVRDAFGRITHHAALVFARDSRSLSYAQEASRHPERLRYSPDLALFQGELPPDGERTGQAYWCLVPNSRLLDIGGGAWGDHYIDFLCLAGRLILDAGMDLKVLVHSREAGDRLIAQTLAELLGPRAEYVDASHSSEASLHAISGAHAVVGSRYHSLVSALSRGVPAIALGWSHKYEGLFADFGIERYCLNGDSSPHDLTAALRELLDASYRSTLSSLLSARLAQLAIENEHMWSSVVAALVDADPATRPVPHTGRFRALSHPLDVVRTRITNPQRARYGLANLLRRIPPPLVHREPGSVLLGTGLPGSANRWILHDENWSHIRNRWEYRRETAASGQSPALVHVSQELGSRVMFRGDGEIDVRSPAGSADRWVYLYIPPEACQWQDYVWSLQIRKRSPFREVQFGLRYQDPYNRYRYRFEDDRVHFDQVVDGVFRNDFSAKPAALHLDQWHEIRMEVVGNVFRCYLDGQLLVDDFDRSRLFMTGSVAIILWEDAETTPISVDIRRLTVAALGRTPRGREQSLVDR